MNAFAFAWRSLIRQPARAVLGIVGVAAVCALLFDMLLLSRGLVLSMGIYSVRRVRHRVSATQSRKRTRREGGGRAAAAGV